MGRTKPKARTILGVVLIVAGACPAAGGDILTICDVQHATAANDWKSAYEGQVVSIVGGVVTHTIGFRITIQDPALGSAWAGIEIRAFENEEPLGVVRPGDRVDFYDLFVEEFRGGTIPQFKSYSSFAVVSSGNPLPNPITIPVADLAYPPDPERCERYEGMLIAVADVRVGRMDWGKAEDNYELTSGGYSMWASDYYNLDLAVPPFPTYYVSPGERYARIVGVFQEYSYAQDGWDYYQLLPRGAADYEKSSICTIRDLQESSSSAAWESPLKGQRISVQGILSADGATGGSAALCDPELGPAWAGVLIADPAGRLTALRVGDEVLLQEALVTEEDGMTLLYYDEQSSHSVVSRDHPVVPTAVTTRDLSRSAGPETAERYEGMWVALYNSSVAACGVLEGDNLYYLAAEGDTILACDGASEVLVSGQAFFVREGDRLGRIAGLVMQRPVPGGTAYILEPRHGRDYYFMTGSSLYTTWGRLKALFREE